MKLAMAHIFFLLGAAVCSSATSAAHAAGDKTITKVVKLLQEMLEKSEKDGDKDRDLYAKFKCYCDDNEESKKIAIKDLTKQIAVLENQIAGLQSSTGGLSEECAKLKEDMAANEAARAEAETIRKKAHEDFVAEEADLTGAIGQLKEAIEVLAAVGGDQTAAASAEHEQFMAGKGKGPAPAPPAALASLDTQVHTALVAASAFLSKKQRKVVEVFLQRAGNKSPFGTYSAQSGEVVGILKEMRTTFEANLEAAQAQEKADVEAHEKFMKIKKAAFEEMKTEYTAKQSKLGSNDGDLADKKSQLADAEEEKASDEDFLAKLIVMCEEKAKDYESRKQMRANEEAAISEAISILNSDAAFETFGKVKATSEGGTGPALLQLISRHRRHERNVRTQVHDLLQSVAAKHQSIRVAQVMALLDAGNPFDKVLAEIRKIVAIIMEEGKVDKENLDWCNSERSNNDADLDAHKEHISTLKTEVGDIDIAINDPETGLLAQIKQTEKSLEDNHKSQVTETKTRGEENTNYQQTIADTVDAESILKKGIKVLKDFYAKAEKEAAEAESLFQRQHDDPAPPSTWEEYKGQSGKGKDAVSMLEFILSETQKEEKMAHEDEAKAQVAYEDSMADLKKKQEESSKTMANLKVTLAEKEGELLEKKAELAETVEGKEAIEAYLEKIKPGCDFITENFDARKSNRDSEMAALEEAVKLLKASPAFKAATVKAEQDAMGECKEICVGNEAHAKCKACLAGVTVPGYCAGHAGTEGCDGSAPAPA